MSVKGTNWVQVEKGDVFRQAHQYEGRGLKEEELGRSGFTGRAVQLYHLHEPNAGVAPAPFREKNVRSEVLDVPDEQDPAALPLRLFSNEVAGVWLSKRSADMPHARRNLGADEVHFVHEGSGRFVTEFGVIPYEPGDFVVLPRAVTYQVFPDSPQNRFFILESVDPLLPPEPGPFGRHVPFDPSVLFIPEPEVQPFEGDGYDVLLKRGCDTAVMRLPHSPFDVVGWKGDYFPYKLASRDWNPVLSTGVHLPPSSYVFLQTGRIFLVNMMPRLMETHPRTERLPYYHRNLDFDEVSFIHDGAMGVLPMPAGMVAHTPQGINHGPSEQAREKQRASYAPGMSSTLHLVMVESFLPFTNEIPRPSHA